MISPHATKTGVTYFNINFKYFFVNNDVPELVNSLSSVLGIIHPIRKETRKPPKISNTLAIASILPNKSVLMAEGIPSKKIKITVMKEALFLFNLYLSISVDTGISMREIKEVIAAK